MKKIIPFFIFVMISGCATSKNARRAGFFDRFKSSSGRLANVDRSNIYHVNKSESDPYLPESSPQSLKRIKELARDWKWPLKNVEITSQFGQRTREFHEGIDLRAQSGTPIYSVDDGVIIYAGSKIKGYGRMLIVKHDSDLSSVYAHASKLLAKRGDRIKKGQLIAYSGASGKVSGPHLHFEVRQGVMAIDPAQVLSGRATASVTDTKTDLDQGPVADSSLEDEKRRSKMKQSLATVEESK